MLLRLTLILVLLLFGRLSLSKEILIVGDSLTCGPFGARLTQNLSRDPQNHVTVYCTISSSPRNWINGTNPGKFQCHSCSGSECSDWIRKNWPDQPTSLCQDAGAGQTPKFEDLLKKKKYDQVLIAHGTNSLPSKKVDANYGKMVELIKKNQNEDCTWIGPPHFDVSKQIENKKMEESLPDFYESLASNVRGPKKCSLIDSRDFTANPGPDDTTPDGIHRNASSGQKWADGVTALLAR